MNGIYRTITTFDWMTIILLGSLIIFSLGKYLYKHTFFTFLILPFNNKYLALNKKKGQFFQGFHILSTIFQLFNLSLLLYLSRIIVLDKNTNDYPVVFLLILITLLGFLLVKMGLQLGGGYFFESSNLVKDLIFEKLTFLNYSGIIAFLGNIVLIYIFKDSKSVVYIIIGLILSINFIGLVNVVRIHQKFILRNVLYFILYLCTLEIAPLVILGSYLKD